MDRAALVVHTFSYPFIRNVAHFIHDALREHLDVDARLVVSETVDAAEYDENTAVFLIGENFPLFRRQPGCRYVYLNFSVVTVLGQSWQTGVEARYAIFRKWRMMAKRMSSVDVLLDYYPPQTQVLQRKMKRPVLGFAVASPPNRDYIPMRARKYDVCFVGNLNARRQSVCQAIADLGLSLSPSKDIVIEDAAAASRICLNVHSVRSHHFETPRFVAALSSGTQVVSEPCYGSDTVVKQEFISEGRLSDLPSTIERLLSVPDRLENSGLSAHRWYTDSYYPDAHKMWGQTIADLKCHLS